MTLLLTVLGALTYTAGCIAYLAALPVELRSPLFQIAASLLGLALVSYRRDVRLARANRLPAKELVA